MNNIEVKNSENQETEILENDINNTNEVDENVEKKNTDPRPVIFDFDEDSDKLLETFTNKIKPIAGIIKYKMTKWEEFPKDKEEAQKLSKSWINFFNKNDKYDNVNFKIYFHLERKTIRFELSERNIIDIDDLEVSTFLKHIEPKEKTYYFDISNYSDLESLNVKKFSKNLAINIEKVYANENIKTIIFINTANNYLKMTLKNKI